MAVESTAVAIALYQFEPNTTTCIYGLKHSSKIPFEPASPAVPSETPRGPDSALDSLLRVHPANVFLCNGNTPNSSEKAACLVQAQKRSFLTATSCGELWKRMTNARHAWKKGHNTCSSGFPNQEHQCHFFNTHSLKKKKKSRFFYWARNVSTPCQDQARIKRGYPHHKQECADSITAIYMCLRMMRRCNSKFYLWVAFLQFLCVLTMAMFSPYKRCMCDISSEFLQACASSAMIPSSLASNFFALSQFNASMLYYVFVYAL